MSAAAAKSEGVQAHIEALLTERGAIKAADHPNLRAALYRAKDDGLLASPLPGTFVAPGVTSGVGWLRAVAAWSAPQGVVHDRSAAGLWLPVEPTAHTHLAHPTLRARGNVVVSRRPIPAEFVVTHQGVRAASPAFAAVELAANDDGQAICAALRLRLANQDSVRAAMAALSGTRGHRLRQEAVQAAADSPWSYAELRLHRILRAGGILGWVANRPLRLRGKVYFPDVRFRSRRFILEFDGREFHDTSAAFISVRERLNDFAAGGFVVVRLGWEHLDDPTYVISIARRSLRTASPYR